MPSHSHSHRHPSPPRCPDYARSDSKPRLVEASSTHRRGRSRSRSPRASSKEGRHRSCSHHHHSHHRRDSSSRRYDDDEEEERRSSRGRTRRIDEREEEDERRKPSSRKRREEERSRSPHRHTKKSREDERESRGDWNGRTRAWDEEGKLKGEGEGGRGAGGGGGKVEVRVEQRKQDGSGAAVESTLGSHDLITSGRRFVFEHPLNIRSASSKADTASDWRIGSKIDSARTSFGSSGSKREKRDLHAASSKPACWRLEQLGYCVETGSWPFYHSPGFTGLKKPSATAVEDPGASSSKPLHSRADRNSSTSTSLPSVIDLPTPSRDSPEPVNDGEDPHQVGNDELSQLRTRVTCLERDDSSLEMRLAVLEQVFESGLFQQHLPPTLPSHSQSQLHSLSPPTLPLLSSSYSPKEEDEQDLAYQLEEERARHALERKKLEEEIRVLREHQRSGSGGSRALGVGRSGKERLEKG